MRCYPIVTELRGIEYHRSPLLVKSEAHEHLRFGYPRVQPWEEKLAPALSRREPLAGEHEKCGLAFWWLQEQ